MVIEIPATKNPWHKDVVGRSTPVQMCMIYFYIGKTGVLLDGIRFFGVGVGVGVGGGGGGWGGGGGMLLKLSQTRRGGASFEIGLSRIFFTQKLHVYIYIYPSVFI